MLCYVNNNYIKYYFNLNENIDTHRVSKILPLCILEFVISVFIISQLISYNYLITFV